MTTVYNVYCDESGHLEHDQIPVMVLGAVWCPLDKTAEIAARLREIKADAAPRGTASLLFLRVADELLPLSCIFD